VASSGEPVAGSRERATRRLSLIPKNIIQTGKLANPSLKDRAMASTVRLWNPEFTYRYFDNPGVDAFIAREFPQYLNVFNAFPYRIQKYDFFRYLAIYHFGGFYFDLDVLLARPLTPLLTAGCVFPFEGLTFSRHLRRQNWDWQIGNYAFGAAAGHPFLRAVIENCVRAQKEPAWLRPMMEGTPRFSREEFIVLNSTGPGLLSRTLAENPHLNSDVAVLFPDDVCDTEKWNRFGDVGVHLMDGSWRSANGFFRRRLAQRWEVRLMNRLIAESRRRGKSREYSGLVLRASGKAVTDDSAASLQSSADT
jgi:hypothetical protein